MDLVAGVKRIFVITKHVTKNRDPKIVNECSFPLTGKQVVETIYTDLAVIDVKEDGLHVREMAPGVSMEYLQERTGPRLK